MPIVRTTRVTDHNGQARMVLPAGPKRQITEIEGALFEVGDWVIIQVDGPDLQMMYTDEKVGIAPILPPDKYGQGVTVIFEHRREGDAVEGEQVTFVTEN